MAVDGFRSRIGSALANRDVAEFEAAFRQYAGVQPEDWSWLVQAAEQLGRIDKAGLGSDLLLSLAQSLSDKGDLESALKVAKAALRGSQKTAGLREFLVGLYRKRHASNPRFEDFLAKSGMTGEGPLRSQVEALDRFLMFEEGAYVFHRGGWGFGIVVEFDAATEQMTVDFQKKKGHQIGISSATKILERLPAEHIGVYLTYRRDELAKIIQEQPAQVFRIYLQDHGGKAPLKDIRESIVPAMMTKEEWSRWWGRAKKALLTDPSITIGKGASPMVELRVHAKSIETEIAEAMGAQASAIRKVAVAREYLRTVDLTPEIAAAVGAAVDRCLASEKGSSARLALLLLKSELKGPEAAAALEEARALVIATAELVPLVMPLESSDRKKAVQLLAKGGPEGWTDRLAAALGSGDVEVADIAFECLRESRRDLVDTFVANLLAQPNANPFLFLWFARGVFEGTIPPELARGETKSTALEKLLTLANTIGREQKRVGGDEAKEFLRQVRNFLTSRKLRPFEQYVRELPIDYARFLYAKIQRNRGITDQTKGILLESIESEHPQVQAALEAKEEAGAAADEFIYTSIEGYHRKEAELRQLREVEVPQNAADLGRAASFGDISENAEYSAALEKQAFLMRRIGELQQDLERARIIEPAAVTSERVVLGTRVRVQNLHRGTEESYCILGPWDVNLEKGVISYLSPVGKGLLGKERGGVADVTLPDGKVTYKILDIALDEAFTAARAH